jgi:hypothetical protein
MRIFNVNIGLNPGTILLGAAAVVIAPMVLTVAGGVLRSLAKAGIKGGIMAVEKSKELAAETQSTLHSITDEARAELASKDEEKVVSMKKKST